MQVLFIGNIAVSNWYITPYLYIAAILLLPFETPMWFSLISAFALGQLVDIFSDTGGMHTFATVLTAFMRPFVLQALSPRGGYEFSMQPRVNILGFNWFLKYTLVAVGIHHIIFFLLDAFSMSFFFMKLHVLALSYISSVVLIILSQFLIFKN